VHVTPEHVTRAVIFRDQLVAIEEEVRRARRAAAVLNSCPAGS
jgi:hypothetical protein